MAELSVGKLYLPSRTRWPEAVEYNYDAAGHELRLFQTRLTPGEVLDVRRGRARFALVEKPPVIFLVWRLGEAWPWSDCPYSWWMVPDDRRQLPERMAGPETRALLQIPLVEANTGILKAIRVVSFAPDFSEALHAAIRRQANSLPLDQAVYDTALANLYRVYPDSTDLLRAAVVRCEGGT